MSRLLLGCTVMVLAVGSVVAIVRAQDSNDSQPPLQNAADEPKSGSGVEPIPAATLKSPFIQESNVPTPAIAVPAQATESSTDEPTATPKRPSAADRLKQVRESTKTSQRKTGSSLGGPVATDPTTVGREPVEIPSETPAIISPPDDAKSTTSVSDSGPSVLKKTPGGGSIGDRSTARRVLRSPAKSSFSDSPSSPANSGAAVTPPVTRGPTAGTLSVSQGPGIRVETIGPSAIVIGKEAEYSLVVHNDSDVTVNEVLLRAGLPASVKASSDGSTADTMPPGESDRQRLGWTIPRIGPRSSEKLSIRVTPTENRPIELMIDWTIRPVSTIAQIEVRQPQLELSVLGRRDVLYGESSVYTIRLSNPGNGNAEDVSLQFGYGDSRLEPKSIGTLAAGQQTEVTVELNARQAGTIQVKAMATGAGGLHTETTQEVFVRRAKLEVEVTGDPVKFAGSTATFRVAVRNTGDAPATDVTTNVNLPRGATVKKASDGAKVESDIVHWGIGSLATNGERVLDLQVVLSTPGDNQVSVRATGATEIEATGSCIVRVDALADLKLSIVDPSGPVELGKDAMFEIHIANRGTKVATAVSVMAQFSRGIEPQEASGAQAEIVPGQVLFQPIPRIEPGQKVILTIKARADSEGNKLFRAEVSCEESNTQLVAQEATYFFSETTRRNGTTTNR